MSVGIFRDITFTGVALFTAACSLQNHTQEGAVVTLELPGSNNHSSELEPFNTPSTLSDFNCYAVNITGAGIPSSCTGPGASTTPGQYLGVTTGAFASTQSTVTLVVPNGTARNIQLIGFDNTAGAGCFPIGSSQNSSGYVLATTTLDITGDVSVSLTASFNSNATQTLFGSNCSVTTGSASTLSAPKGVAVDASGNAYIADTGNNVIRKVTSGGVMTIFAGTGAAGYSGDNGQATSAQLSGPVGLALDSGPTALYVADKGNNVIRKIVISSGVISTVAGTGTSGYNGDGGVATNAKLNAPSGVAIDSSGDIYIADTSNNVIREVNSSGYISTVAGNTTAGFSGNGSAATSAELNAPQGIAVRGSTLYIADTGNYAVRTVISSTISAFAGTGGSPGSSGDGGAASGALLGGPTSVALDSFGSVYIADPVNSAIRVVSTALNISTYAGTNGSSGYSGDGATPTSALLKLPSGVAVQPGSNYVFIADTNNSAIREVNISTGDISTFFH